MEAVVRFRALGPAHRSGAVPEDLSEAEVARWLRLRDPRDRAAYAAAHRLVRACAAEVLACGVEELEVELSCAGCGSTAHGPPRVRGADGLTLSLSHTRTHVGAGAAPGGCGVDVEPRGASVPKRALTQDERRWLALPAGQGHASRLWVRKEALVKVGATTLDDLASTQVVDQYGPARVHAVDEQVWALGEWSDEAAVGAWAVPAGTPVTVG